MTHDTPSQVLAAAADMLDAEPGAWRQWGQPHKPGAMCMIEAAAYFVGPAVKWPMIRDFIASALKTTRADVWNDTPGRTQEEVVAALRRAAEIARERGQ